MFDAKTRFLPRGLLSVLLAVNIVLLTGGCNLIVEPIERNFLFRPRSPDSARLILLAENNNGIEEVSLKTPDGVMLRGWLKHPKEVRSSRRFPLVIVFGGVRRETSWMIDRAVKPENWGWLFINYRGFGLSEGEPSERALLQDASLIYDYAATRSDIDASNIVVLGRSLGSYFTIALAKSRPLRGTILATPFDSIAALAEERYPWFPFAFLLNGRYDSATMAPTIKAPALFVLAERDDVTPVLNGIALARAWGGPQRLVTLADARHYGVERRVEFWNAVEEFLRDVELSPHNGYVMESGAQANQ